MNAAFTREPEADDTEIDMVAGFLMFLKDRQITRRNAKQWAIHRRIMATTFPVLVLFVAVAFTAPTFAIATWDVYEGGNWNDNAKWANGVPKSGQPLVIFPDTPSHDTIDVDLRLGDTSDGVELQLDHPGTVNLNTVDTTFPPGIQLLNSPIIDINDGIHNIKLPLTVTSPLIIQPDHNTRSNINRDLTTYTVSLDITGKRATGVVAMGDHANSFNGLSISNATYDVATVGRIAPGHGLDTLAPHNGLSLNDDAQLAFDLLRNITEADELMLASGTPVGPGSGSAGLIIEDFDGTIADGQQFTLSDRSARAASVPGITRDDSRFASNSPESGIPAPESESFALTTRENSGTVVLVLAGALLLSPIPRPRRRECGYGHPTRPRHDHEMRRQHCNTHAPRQRQQSH